MKAELVVPVLNVSSIEATFAWFEKLGWRQGFAWDPEPGAAPVFGSVLCDDCEIFLCLGAQGGRGKGSNKMTFGESEMADKGVWMSIWVDDVDAVHELCVREGLEVTHGPADEVWHVREVHVRHPDGHVLRFSRALGLG